MSLNAEWQELVDEHHHAEQVRNQARIRHVVLIGCVVVLILAFVCAVTGAFIPTI